MISQIYSGPKGVGFFDFEPSGKMASTVQYFVRRSYGSQHAGDPELLYIDRIYMQNLILLCRTETAGSRLAMPETGEKQRQLLGREQS